MEVTYDEKDKGQQGMREQSEDLRTWVGTENTSGLQLVSVAHARANAASSRRLLAQSRSGTQTTSAKTPEVRGASNDEWY